jgi:hypothetical protein
LIIHGYRHDIKSEKDINGARKQLIPE